MSLNRPIIAELKQEAATTRRVLERVPGDSLGWKPHEKSMALGRLASHVPELLSWISAVLTQDELDFAKGGYNPPAPDSVAAILEMFDRNVAQALDLLQGQPDEHLLKRWQLKGGDKVLVDLRRLDVIRTVILNHVIHHRGQLTVYLRLLNVPLPSVYGPTADEPMQ